MTDLFTSDFFTNNRKKLQEETSAQIIIIAANGLLQRSADTTYPFRQDSNFWYLTGVEEPDYLLVITEDEDFLIAPKRGEHRDQWDGSIDKKAIKQLSGIGKIEEHHAGWIRLDLLLKKHKKAHTVTPAEAYFDHFGFYSNPARATLLSALAKHRRLELVDIRKCIAGLRQVKLDPEIKALQMAIDITSISLKNVKKKLESYKSENQIVADITRDFIRRGADNHAYQPIVAAGANATTIHYIKNNHAIESGELVLFDVGAEFNNYSADISRTYATSQPTKRQQDVFNAVKTVQQKAMDLLKPGVDMKKYEQDVDAIMAKELKKLKLIDDLTDKKKLKKYYPHLTSHFLGLDTHDSADYTKPLVAGVVLTVEPGIYIPEEGIGIRIEDDVLITDDGIKVLSAGLPTELR